MHCCRRSKNGTVKRLVVDWLDRLTRRLIDLLILLELFADYQVELVARLIGFQSSIVQIHRDARELVKLARFAKCLTKTLMPRGPVSVFAMRKPLLLAGSINSTLANLTFRTSKTCVSGQPHSNSLACDPSHHI